MEEERKIFEALFCVEVLRYRCSKLLVYAVKTALQQRDIL